MINLFIVFLFSFKVYSEDAKLVRRTVCVLDPVNMSETEGQFGFTGSLVSDMVSIMLKEAVYKVLESSVCRIVVYGFKKGPAGVVFMIPYHRAFYEFLNSALRQVPRNGKISGSVTVR